MAEITASAVKELREKTGAGMMDCKNALKENDGDMEAAIDWLRTKGLAKAAKKAGRVAAEGLVAVTAKGGTGSIVEVNSETDFVARNDKFQDLVLSVVNMAMDVAGDFDNLLQSVVPGAGKPLSDHITDMVATIGENLSARRSAAITVEPGVVASYIHSQVAPGLGKIGVIVGLQSEADAEKLEEFGRQVAMHIAASRPLAVTTEELDPALVEKEKEILAAEARESGKPENIIEKMVEGRMRKYFEEVVLLQQPFVMDPDKTVGAVLAEKEKELGSPIKITSFVRFELGEGIDKKEEDFAAEVAAAASN